MNGKQETMVTSCKVISVIMKVLCIVMAVEMVLCGAGLVILALTHGESAFFSIGTVKIIAVGADVETPEGAAAICGAAAVLGAFLFAVFFLAYKMFRDINVARTPFDPKHVRTIKSIGVLVAVMTVVSNIVDRVAAEFNTTATVGMGVDSSVILIGVVIYCLAYIFDYGCALQKQSDETL